MRVDPPLQGRVKSASGAAAHDRPRPLPRLRRRPRAARHGRRLSRRRAFLQAHPGVRAGRGGAAVRRRRGRSASRCMAAAFSPAPATANASSPAATTAGWSRPRADGDARTNSPPTTSGAGSTRSRSGPTARSPGRPARPRMSRTGKGELRALELPSTVAGLCFAPKGFRLAIAHYNGVTFWFPNAAGAKPEVFEWKGSHLVRHRQPGRPLPGHLDAGADAARLAHRRRQAHAHVGLFGARALARRGPRTATSSPPRAPSNSILWPFDGKDGPMGRQPQAARAVGSARHRWSPAIPSSRWWRSAMPTAWSCWCASRTAR